MFIASAFEVHCFLFSLLLLLLLLLFLLFSLSLQGGGDSVSGISIVGIISIFGGALFVLQLQRTADSTLD